MAAGVGVTDDVPIGANGVGPNPGAVCLHAGDEPRRDQGAPSGPGRVDTGKPEIVGVRDSCAGTVSGPKFNELIPGLLECSGCITLVWITHIGNPFTEERP